MSQQDTPINTLSRARNRELAHRAIYFLMLAMMLVAMPMSNFVMNMAWVFLLINWLIEGQFAEKRRRAKESKLLQAYTATFAVMLVGLCWSSNWANGLDYIRKMLPFVAVPIVVLTTKPLRTKALTVLMCLYATTVTVLTIIGCARYFSIPNLPYRDMVPYISHIRFALNVSMVICMALYTLARTTFSESVRQQFAPKPLTIVRAICIVLTLWMLGFLLLMRSYTAFIALAFALSSIVFFYGKRFGSRLWHIFATSFVIGAITAVAITVGSCVKEYYQPNQLEQEPLPALTANNRPYTHGDTKLIECGGYIDHYVCKEELETAWKARSGQALDSPTPNGYTVEPTLIRYLNAKGLTKDSLGVAALSESDINNIRLGVANPVYAKPLSIRCMVSTMLFEYESYRRLHRVKDFTMLQRFELWKAAWQVAQGNIWFGVGTGDATDLCHRKLAEMNSELTGTTKHTHNQYLSLLTAFGIIGLGIIVWTFVRAYRRQRLMRSTLLAAHTIIVLISCISEDTIETLAGCLFVVALNSLLAADLDSTDERELHIAHTHQQ